MQKKKKRVLNTVEQINDSVLIPNVSLGQFVFGSNIKLYLNNTTYLYEENPDKMKGYGFDCYYFDKLDLEVWTDEKGVIDSIRTEHECNWRNINLIGLRYNKFKSVFKLGPDTEDICYLYDGTSQHVYDFESVGLQLWVRYGIIKTVIASKIIND